MLLRLLMALFIPTIVLAQDNTQFQERCGQEGFACAECETNLQRGFDQLLGQFTTGGFQGATPWGRTDAMPASLGLTENLTAEQALSQITDLFRSQNNGELNYIVIGESESVQGTSVTNGRLNPRIALKSPNSELWVTFNTDPNDPGFNKLEIMRWNGREARYEFMEMDFTPGHRALDTKGESCMECHKKPDPRPNWDTYRAWAGVVPARDDMIEAQTIEKPAEGSPAAASYDPAYRGTKGAYAPPAADGRAYLGFLGQVADARMGRMVSPAPTGTALIAEQRRRSRLATLNIPVDKEAGQLDAAVRTMTPDEQVRAIRDRITSDGFYRVPHYPIAKNLNGNFDGKTAPYAGSSQLAFDHLSGQNMCRISNDLKKNPKYPRFKYLLAGMAQGCFPAAPIRYNDGTYLNVMDPTADPDNPPPALTEAAFTDWMSPAGRTAVSESFRRQGSTLLGSLQERDRTPAGGFASTVDAVVRDTNANHGRANDIKRERQTRFVERYLTEGERMTRAAAAPQVRSAVNMVAPTQSGFHAIGDEGGVAGVPEAHTNHLAALRLTLEPFGVNMGDWSLMRGPDTSYDSYAFSDQFVLFFNQPAVTEPANEVIDALTATGATYGPEDVCKELQRRSVAAFGDGPAGAAVPVEPSENVVEQPYDLASICQTLPGEPSLEDIKSVMNVARVAIEPNARQHFKVCADCHDGSMAVTFAGMENWSGDWTDASWLRFNDYLRGIEGDQRRPMAGSIVRRLDSGEMPMYGWSDHASGALPAAIKSEETERRTILSSYVRLTVATTGREEALRAVCRTVGSDRRGGDDERTTPEAPAPSGGASGR